VRDFAQRAMPIVSTGPVCARRGCGRPEWKDRLCARCRRLADLFGKDPLLFAYEPLHGYADARGAVALPWDELEREARARGVALADLIARGPHPGPPAAS
jgi:hypothetical protein